MKLIYNLFVILVVSAVPLLAEVAETFDVEAGRLAGVASKVAVDVIAHGTDSLGVWLATGRGVNYSFDNGAHWSVNNSASGLPSDNLSAIFSIGRRVWIASNHNDYIQGQLMTLSDGLSYSDDDGLTWTTLDFGPNGLNIPYVIGGDRTIFDITGHYDPGFLNNRVDDTTDWLFAAAFAGGLLASQDGGIHWRRIFASRVDSIQYYLPNEPPSLRNRYFSCVADTSHGDSIFLWAGTASGVFQYVFAPPRNKLYSHWIHDIALCDTCSTGGGSRLYIAGETGVSLGSAAGGPIVSRFAVDGLPVSGPRAASILSVGDRLFVGTVNPNTGGSTGLYVSDDRGESFAQRIGPWATGVGRVVSDFAQMNGRIYAAVQVAGLFVSADTGQFWSGVALDLYFSEPALRTANALTVFEDTLLVGTDSGLITLALDGDGNILSATHDDFPDTDSTSTRIVRVKVQRFENATVPGTYDSTIVWTVNRPRTVSGRPMVGRRNASGGWTYLRRGIDVYDVSFFSDTVFAVGATAIWFSPRGQEMTNFFSARQYVNDDPDSTVIDNLDQDSVTVMEVRQDTVIFGTSDGIAISHNRGRTFKIYRANTDTLSADFVVNHSYLNSFGGLAGDFIPALAVQYREADSVARIWAGARPAGFGGQGISVGDYYPGGVLRWETVYDADFAWNFEFVGDTILSASNRGLLLNEGPLDSLNTVWGTVDFTDVSSGQVLVAPGTPVYSVGLVDSTLWVGTDDGIVRLNRSDLGKQELFQRVDSAAAAGEVYAFPVPFRPGQGQVVDFHFTVETAGNVTLEVYDFAMNLVATPIDNVAYAAGIYPAQGAQGVTWDGRNDKGDLVAVGIYYFKVEIDSGEPRWGKLAVIP
ncbi:MAG: hypothetical protein AB1772_05695 [Candidatus Zixiibacteriota bacterium]